MRTIISAAVSLDGYLDDCSPGRLKLSSPEDWAQVLAMRSRCDAILVGAGTVRADNPSLVIKDDKAKELRKAMGMDPELVKVTVTRSGDIDSSCEFFTRGGGRKIVFCTSQTPAAKVEQLRRLADVFVEAEITPATITRTLEAEGYNTLMVEGGSMILGMFLQTGGFDLLRLARAPFFIGDGNAPRFVPQWSYPWHKEHRLLPRGLEQLGDTSVTWLTTPVVAAADRGHLAAAVELSRNSPPSDSAYRVGAVVVTATGQLFPGYTHEAGPSEHAEEVAIAKAQAAGCRLTGATVYSSMEPCTHRKSKPLSCTDLIIRKGFSKVVYALAEPAALAICEGDARLRAAGLEVVHDSSFEGEVRQINGHILGLN